MPSKHTWKDVNIGANVELDIEGDECEYNGCTQYVVIGRPYCIKHTTKVFGVTILYIQDKGYGLFANKNFKYGDMICPYYAERLTKYKFEKRYPPKSDATCPYVYESPQRIYWDGATIRGVGCLCNTAVDESSNKSNSEKCNAFIIADACPTLFPSYPWVVATKNISKGDEILVDYGCDYELDTAQWVDI